MKVSVNGKAVAEGQPGTYLSLKRRWSSGDIIDFALPAVIRVKSYRGEDQVAGKPRYSVEYGPILLAAIGVPQTGLSIDGGQDAEHLASQLMPIDNSPLHLMVRGNPGVRFMPYWQVSEEEFTCYPSVYSAS